MHNYSNSSKTNTKSNNNNDNHKTEDTVASRRVGVATDLANDVCHEARYLPEAAA